MIFRRYASLCAAAVFPIALASCSGASHQDNPPVQQQSLQQPAKSQQLTVTASGGTRAGLSVRSATPLSGALTLEPGAISFTCRSIPGLQFRNPYPYQITLSISSFTINSPCATEGKLFGASFYQLKPLPPNVEPLKVGDGTGTGNSVTFNLPSPVTLTLAPSSLSIIRILPESSTSDTQFPVAPGSTTLLTSNSPSLPSGLTFTYANAGGAASYNAACFNAYEDGVLAPALQGVPLVGTPSFYCTITPPQGATLSFGQIVTFQVVAPKPDRAVFEPDGNAQGFACDANSSCNVPGFKVPTTYSNFISGNVQDLRECVPSQKNVDCNGVPGDPQAPPAAGVSYPGQFQLLVADDPTYTPSTESTPVPWDGLFRMTLTGPCHLILKGDNDNGDHPPLYTDFAAKGVGPNAEFDVITTGPGTCNITAGEDPKFILDYTDPANPHPRMTTISVPVNASP